MTSELIKWVTSQPKGLAYAGASLVSVGLLAVALHWRKEKPLQALKWHSDGLTRPLSNLDRWYNVHNLAHTQPNFYVTALLTGAPWTRSQAEIVLTRVMRHHAPSMCSIVNKDDPKRPPYWRRLWHPSYAEDEQGILDIYIETRSSDAKDDESWRDFARIHEEAGFSVSRPNYTPFRLVIVRREGCPHFEVVFIPDHAICDGRGSIYFLRQLLEEFSICESQGWNTVQAVDLRAVKLVDSPLCSGKKAKDVDLAAKIANNEEPWPAELEAHINVKPSLFFLLKTFLADRFSSLRPVSPAWIGPVDRGTVLRPTRTQVWTKVPSHLVASLRATCRARNTTVSAALWGAIVFALLRTFRRTLKETPEAQTGHKANAKDEDEVSFKLGNPIDMRSRCEVPNSHLSPLIIGIDFIAGASSSSAFWKKSSQIQKILVDTTPEAIETNGLIGLVPSPGVPWVFGREARAPNGRRDTFVISNLGCLEFEPSYGSTICRDVWFGRHTVRNGSMFTMFVLTPGKDRDMNLAFTSPTELLYSPEAVEFFSSTLVEVLTKAVDNGFIDDFTYSDLYKGE